jgi:hypothetical protein
MTAAPDYVEPIVGWRVWSAVDDDEGETCLSSIVYRTLWPIGAPLAAECRGCRMSLWLFRRARHEAPTVECRCGIHAATVTMMHAHLGEYLTSTEFVPVLGEVSLWGVVHEARGGWRASLAYPRTLFVPVLGSGWGRAERIVNDLHRYRVPVRAVSGTSVEAVFEEATALAAA